MEPMLNTHRRSQACLLVSLNDFRDQTCSFQNEQSFVCGALFKLKSNKHERNRLIQYGKVWWEDLKPKLQSVSHVGKKTKLQQCKKQKKLIFLDNLTENFYFRNSKSGPLVEIKHPTAQTERSETRGHQEIKSKKEASVKRLKQVRCRHVSESQTADFCSRSVDLLYNQSTIKAIKASKA